MPGQKTAPETDSVEHAGKHRARLVVHERNRARQLGGRRVPIAGARIGEDSDGGGGGQLVRKAAPYPGGAEPLVQQHDGRRHIRPRPDHAIFEPHVGEIQKALVGEVGHADPAFAA